MGWVARCIRGGISPPHPDPWTVRRCTTSDVPAVYGTPDGGSGAALGTKSLDLVLLIRSSFPPSLSLYLSLSLFHVCEHLPPRRELPSPCSPLFFSRGSQGELLKLYCWALKRRKRRKNNMTLLPSAEAKEKKLYMRLERERERKSGCVVVVFAVFRQPLSRLALVESPRQFQRDT